MDDQLRHALQYLSAPAGSFWKWVDNGDVVRWSHGVTIAFREELAIVLKRLEPRGLPALDSVLLLIAATRTSWLEDCSGLSRLSQQSSSAPVLHVMELLNQVHNLPEDLIRSVEAKGDLAEIVFESIPRVIKDEAAQNVCEILSQGLFREKRMIPNLARLHGGRVQTTKSLTAELLQLGLGLEGISESSLRLRLKTGLDEAPSSAEVEVPVDPQSVRSLLQELALDEELSGLTRIARSLSAVLQLPRSLSDSDELPLGGVSDISNRGTLDRLLLSELAHDDLMLATRVALNEALYLRREAPPSPPPLRRQLLVDSGLRMWGVPRVYAAAAMMSLAATSPDESTLLTYRASGTSLVPIDPATRAGVVEHLEALEAEVHPGQALPAFFDVMKSGRLPGDAVIITSDAALRDPDFQRMLLDAPPVYLATVGRGGEFQLWLRGVRGTKRLTSLKLDLDELLKPPARPHVKLVDSDLDPNLPAIFHVTPFPLRLPYQRSHRDSEPVWSVRLPETPSYDRPAIAPLQGTLAKSGARGVLLITRDRRLILFDAPQRGAVEIAHGMPSGSLLWSGSSSNQELTYALIHQPSEPAIHLICVSLTQKRLIMTRKLPSKVLTHKSEILGVARQADLVFVLFRGKVEAFDLTLGELHLQVEMSNRLKWCGGRFYTNPDAPSHEEWGALTCDGTSFRFEQIPLRGPAVRMLHLFDRPGHDGPFGVHAGGSIVNLSNQTEWNWTTNSRSNPVVLNVDDDGNRILLEQNVEPKDDDTWSEESRRTRRVVDLESKSCVDVSMQTATLAAWDLGQRSLGGSLMRRFSTIHVGENGNLTLTSKTKTSRDFVVYQKRLVLRKVPYGQTRRLHVAFEPARHPNPACTMVVATWPDGSRAFIDSRGMLHLQSSDRSIPEATLVLHESDVSVWTSDGRTCGPAYFTTPSQFVSMTAVDCEQQILIPFIERLNTSNG